MSKIMRQLYSEARAAREAAENSRLSPAPSVAPTLAAAEIQARTGIEWWKAVYERAGSALRDAQAEVTKTAVQAVQTPSTPGQHVEWWRKQMKL